MLGSCLDSVGQALSSESGGSRTKSWGMPRAGSEVCGGKLELTFLRAQGGGLLKRSLSSLLSPSSQKHGSVALSGATIRSG